MTRVAMDSIPEDEAERIFLAGKLNEAKEVEELLTRAGVHYAVEVEPYRGSGLLSSFFEYQGAMFYVRSDQAVFCRQKLVDGGFEYGVILKE